MPKRNRITDLLPTRLATEERFLGMPYFTWWFEYGRLELFEPLTGLIPSSRWGEWERLVHNLPEATLELIGGHDALVEELRDVCARLQEALENGPELQEIYHRRMTPEFLTGTGTTEAELFGARWPDALFPYLAQLIVNATPPDCSPLYTIRPFWLKFGEEFLALRRKEPYREIVERSGEIAGRLLENIRKLRAAFTENRKDVHAA